MEEGSVYWIEYEYILVGHGLCSGEIIIFAVKQSINKMSLNAQFQKPVIALIQRQYPDIRIAVSSPPDQPTQSLYIHAPNPQLSIGDLRFIAEAAEVRVVDAEAIAQRILTFMSNLISTLQNNEACRVSWNMTSIRGREREASINLRELQTQINILKQLIEECKHGVTCKSDLNDLLNRRRTEIFRTVDDSRLSQSLRQLRLPELPQNYEHLGLMSEDSYEMAYESIIQKLLVYQNAVDQFLRQELGFDDFQRICFELMRQDIVLLNNNKTKQLVRYVLHYCTEQYLKFAKMRRRIRQLRSLLIQSILRAYYIAFQAKNQIIDLQQSLNQVEKELLNSGNKMQAMGRNSVTAGSNGQQAIVRLQNNFTAIFTYLTDKNQTIFLNVYQRKLKKRVSRLLKIEDRLTHFFKILFNPDYADYQSSKMQQPDPKLKARRVEQKFKQVWELSQQLRPMNEKQFKLVFQEIQRLGLFVEQTKAGRQWQYKVVQLQKRIINEYLFDKNGQRKHKKDTPMQRFAKSRVGNPNDRSFNSYQVNKDQVFEDTIEQLNQKRNSVTGPQQQAQFILQNMNREEILRQGNSLIDSIRPQFGEQFMDLTNFKAYILTKLTNKVQAALSRTQYGEQPLYLQLTSLIENLNILPSIIKPQINQKKIDLIFFPKVNSQLFSSLRVMMKQHQNSLSAIYLDLSNNPIKAKNLPLAIKGFMENRLRYLHVLLQNIDKLEQIAVTVDGLNLKKISHDITNEATYNLVLKLLLAAKEIKAYQDATRDRISNKDLSAKALKLLSEYIYPNFLNSLLLVFQNNYKQPGPQVLQCLLELSEASRRVTEQSQRYMDTIVRMMEEVIARRVNADVKMLIQEYSITLRAFNARSEQLINQCYKYACINSDALNRQRIRIIEFLELLYNGPRTTAEIINQKSRKLQGLLAELP